MTSQPITLYKIYIKSVHCKCKSHCFNTADINFFRKFKGLKLATSQLLLTIVRVYILYLFKLTTYLKMLHVVLDIRTSLKRASDIQTHLSL